MLKYKIFQKLLTMLALLLIPATLLFAYANEASKEVVKHTLEESASKQLEFTMRQMEQSLRQLETQTLMLVNDSTIRAYASSSDFSEYLNHLFMRTTIEEKLTLQSQAEPLISELTVHWPSIGESITSQGTIPYNYGVLVNKPMNRWIVDKSEGLLSFRLLFSFPAIAPPDLSNTVSIVETTISSDYLRSVLAGLDVSGNGTSFFYFPGADIIRSNDVDMELAMNLIEKGEFDGAAIAHPKLSVMQADGEQYLIQSIFSPSLGGTLVSYIQLDEFLGPLQKVNWLVNGSLAFLAIAGIMISYLFYSHFRKPFGYLVRKLEALGSGDYASRATVKTNNEFDYLFERFNEMASRIQSLIENVYEEKVRTREAEYKHLQSQINPHFLYNCLFYIVSMANKSPAAVVSMAKNLSEFYRYITSKAGSNTTLEDEIRLIESYLEVQSLRNKRLAYEIDIPSAMLGLSVPTLLLQPIVENAIVHGIEQKRTAGKVHIGGIARGDQYLIHVDDDGNGLYGEQLQTLIDNVHGSSQTGDEMGCGLSNVHKRLTNRYGGHSGLTFSTNEWGGLRVTLHLQLTQKAGETDERLISG
ncbi:sensor histidine kinase [Paenibacillus harenae]|uniref:Two-component system sensor histidine kinase YesM n=1 Tax=Paenibacillus harenae TaxID=306543 RepID=A0ABT9U163_PAEHA|nr:histidine kinase [Paenibacillus harenae]MDQ0112154.1 two-component system sensor histidine kinase YesM [Paenibacillus harenae]